MGNVNEIRFKPISPKLHFLYDKHRYKILKGGRGSAKSWGVAEALIYFSTNYKCRILCAREIQKSIQESAKRLLEDTIERYGLTNDFEILKTIIRNPSTGSEIIFEGLKSNTNKIKSLEGIDICWAEEAETISEESWRVLIPTIRKPNSEIWVTFNPRYTIDPTWQMFVENQRPDSFVQTMNYFDNPMFPSDLQKEMEHDKSQDEALYKFVWLGEPMGQEYNTFIVPSIIKDSRERIPVANGEQIVAGLDVSRFGDDMSELIIRQGNNILGEYSNKGLDNINLAEWALNLCLNHGVEKLVVDATGTGSGVFDYLNNRYTSAFDVVEFHGAYAPSDEKYKNLRVEVWDRMRTWIRESGKLTQNKRFDELSLITYFYDSSNKLCLESKEQMRRRGVSSPDAGDALAMTFYEKGNKSVVAKVRKGLFGR